MKTYLWKLRHAAEEDYWNQVLEFLEPVNGGAYLDCGCSDGDRALALARHIGASQIFGVEIVNELADKARKKGITVIREDLNEGLSLPEAEFDAITALEVIEHLHSPDIFLKDLYRILKPGGYAVISTENLSSWHN